jgi:hypothetical protein
MPKDPVCRHSKHALHSKDVVNRFESPDPWKDTRNG